MKITAYKPDISQEYSNPFKENNIYPFSKIGRVIVDKDTGEIKRWCGELDSNYDIDGNPINLDMETEEVMVHIPAFYCKRTWEGEVLTDSILTKVPDILEYQGYEVHPAFVRADGSIREYVLVGAFLGTVVNNQLRSTVKNVTPQNMKTISAFRDLARQGRNINFNIMTLDIFNAIQLLYKISFQNLNSQNELGNSTMSYIKISTTMSLGNRSGYLEDNSHVSLFGIESIYGSKWEFLDGVVIKSSDDGIYYTNDISKFGYLDEYIKLSDTVTIMNGVGVMKGVSSKTSIYNFPKELELEDYNIYYCDYIQGYRKNGQNKALLKGRSWSSDVTTVGLFSLSEVLNYTYYDYSSSARLCYLP